MNSSILLRLQGTHRSSFLNHENPESNKLRLHLHNINQPHQDVVELLKISGFYHASQMGCFVVDAALITALVERWRAETHTFHLPCGECTVTLEDVALHLGLRVNGKPVIGPSYFDWEEMCSRLLGVVPPKDQMKGSSVKIKWLQTTFNDLPAAANPEQIQYFCRAYILRLIGGMLMPDKSSNRVHLMYLPLLEDFERAKQYSWGSACLATLYRELCRATEHDSHAIGGCLWLLQSWAWYRLPFIAPRIDYVPHYPLVRRWSVKLIYVGTPHGNLRLYRECLDRMRHDEFLWMPYSNGKIQACLPPDAFQDANMWNACTVLICFSVIEWHQTDRVRRQFGLQQGIPQSPVNLDDVHKIDMRGNHYINWAEKHAKWLPYWRNRRNYVLEGPSAEGQLLPSTEYMSWFTNNSRPYVSRSQELEDPRSRPVPNISNSANVTQEFDFPKPSRRRATHRRTTKVIPQVEEDDMHQESLESPRDAPQREASQNCADFVRK